MKIDYVIADPTGNITILVTSRVPAELQTRCASELMRLRPECQQVGYVTMNSPSGRPRLRMMGGEFCGNASMSCGAYLASLLNVESLSLLLEVSGADDPVEIRIKGDRGSVRMPLPERVYTDTFDGREAAVVEMPGITHILTDSFDADEAESRMVSWNEKIKADALGVMVMTERWSRMTPVVYVPSTGTIVRESSCASGTAAVGAYLCQKAGKSICLKLPEPAGEMCISAESGRCGVSRLVLSGNVVIKESGSMDIVL